MIFKKIALVLFTIFTFTLYAEDFVKSIENSRATKALTRNKHKNIQMLVGCGLGTKAMVDKRKGNNVMELSTANLLNNISSTQTFGITSGTSGCDDSRVRVSQNSKVAHDYIATNMTQFMLDASYGEGKTLDVVANLISPNDTEGLKKRIYNNYNKIFTSDSVSSEEVINSIYRVAI